MQISETDSLFSAQPQRKVDSTLGDFDVIVMGGVQIRVKCLHCTHEKLYFTGCIRS